MPIGISGQVTINGITLTTGIDRQVLFLQHDAAGTDNLAVRSNTARYAPQAARRRDWVDLDINTLNNFFLVSLNPSDLAGIVLPICSGTDVERARLRYYESFPPGPPAPHFTAGAVDLCAEGSRFSIEISDEVPEPSTLALIVAGLLSILSFGLMRGRADA